MSDLDLLQARWQEEDEQYEACGYPLPAGHPDEWREDFERGEFLHRYFDAPLRAPARESDDWLEPEEEAA